MCKVIKSLRSEFKKLGFTNRAISVKDTQGGYSTCIRVVVKSEDALRHLEEVESICRDHQSYSRDIMSGEILSGGNTFVIVGIDKGAFSKKLDIATTIINKINTETDSVRLFNVLIRKSIDESDTLTIKVDDKKTIRLVEDVETLAKLITQYVREF